MLSILSKIFGGNKSQKDVKLLMPIVDKVGQFFKQYESLSNDELRAKTVEFRARIKSHLLEIDNTIEAKKAEAEVALLRTPALYALLLYEMHLLWCSGSMSYKYRRPAPPSWG